MWRFVKVIKTKSGEAKLQLRKWCQCISNGVSAWVKATTEGYLNRVSNESIFWHTYTVEHCDIKKGTQEEIIAFFALGYNQMKAI